MGINTSAEVCSKWGAARVTPVQPQESMGRRQPVPRQARPRYTLPALISAIAAYSTSAAVPAGVSVYRPRFTRVNQR
ncbi:hypothetical protein M2105_006484 [Paenibacillus sp. PastF-1]|nr:hypothetical protein [Paenibacillus sp. PastF-2]MDF9851959.1 hypothetical protein [Paenibacillus sp. PastM-2]MDF9858556.1 hypothetical protein [Paenibacillus sp. PastF-1]MDH6483822.1 hypothetical protein [Paenibacillus sp. PastH-2]MDH6511203.1 hypothetical protein [Paenibacillus sp. PastM-3]